MFQNPAPPSREELATLLTEQAAPVGWDEREWWNLPEEVEKERRRKRSQVLKEFKSFLEEITSR